MEEQDIRAFRGMLDEIISGALAPEVFQWLNEKAAMVAEDETSVQLQTAFALVPRKTGRAMIDISPETSQAISAAYAGFSLRGWTADRLGRLWLLLQVPDAGREAYAKKIDGLFRDAEMNELVALYSSLGFFLYPEAWKFRATEGIRSNIGIVLEAIMYENPYPGQYLDEQSWNQMIMKAFFTDKAVDRITGLDRRANKSLASMLTDYAQERWAASRSVNPQLWRLVAAFIDEQNFVNIARLFEQGDRTDQQAGALACHGSNYPPAKELLAQYETLSDAIKENRLNWNTVNTLSEQTK